MVKRNILCGVDDTEESERAVQWTLRELYRDGDELFFLHVAPQEQTTIVAGDYAVGETLTQPVVTDEKQLIDEAAAYIERRFVRQAEAAGASYTVEVIQHHDDTQAVGELLCKRAHDLNAVAIVLTKHKTNAIRMFLVGSVTDYVAKHSKQPIMVLH